GCTRSLACCRSGPIPWRWAVDAGAGAPTTKGGAFGAPVPDRVYEGSTIFARIQARRRSALGSSGRPAKAQAHSAELSLLESSAESENWKNRKTATVSARLQSGRSVVLAGSMA